MSFSGLIEEDSPTKMFTRTFEPTKSTKGASKMRRDLINAEIANLRDLLPLPPSTRQRLSQLQLMALICVYVRKANYFQQVLKCHDFSHHYHHHAPTPNIGFSKALNGFLMMMTQNGKLLYISDNAAEYLGHSMEDLLIHGDSVYDIIDKQDHQNVQAELCRPPPPVSPAGPSTAPRDTRMFLCRINVARNARRQMRFGDQKVVLVRGHFLSYLPLCSRNEPVFLAVCSPVAMPETRECVVQGATNVFTTIHSMDMKIKHIDKNGEFYLEWEKSEIQGISWYQLLHWDCMREAQSKHRLITQSEQERSCILLLRLQKRSGDWLWIHAVLQVKDNMENNQQPVIVCTNQVLSESEASIMLANSWLYHYYSVQSKLQYGLTYDVQMQNYYHPSITNYSPSPYTVNQESPYSQHSNEELVHHHNMMNGSEQHLVELQGMHSSRQGTPGVLRHSGHHLIANQGFGFEASMAERGPVDYSRHSSSYTPTSNERYVPQIDGELKTSQPKDGDTIPSIRHHRKRRHSESLTKLETLQVPSVKQQQVVVESESTLLTLSHPSERYRYHTKPGLEDPADFIDRWNPSPPWSDTTLQKVPQAYQEINYISPSPLTPTGTPGVMTSYGGMQNTFTFDWVPEHYSSHVNGVQPVLHIICREDEYMNLDSRPKLMQAVETQSSSTANSPEANVEAS